MKINRTREAARQRAQRRNRSRKANELAIKASEMAMDESFDVSSTTIGEEEIVDMELMFKRSDGNHLFQVQDFEGHVRQEMQSCDVTADLDVGHSCRYCNTPVTGYNKTTAMESYESVMDGWNVVEYQHIDRSNEDLMPRSGFFSQSKRQVKFKDLHANGWKVFFNTDSGYHPLAPPGVWAERTPGNGNWWIVTEPHTALCDVHRESRLISSVSGTRQY